MPTQIDRLSILSKADFSTIKSLTYTGTGLFHTADTLNSNQYSFAYTSSGTSDHALCRYDIQGSGGSGSVIEACLSLLSATYGRPNNILNFGPYQYVVTIPARIDLIVAMNMLVVSKLGAAFASIYQTLTVNGAVGALQYSLAGMTKDTSNDWYYFGVIESTNKNFQSYYLTVSYPLSPCTSTGCTLCDPDPNISSICDLASNFYLYGTPCVHNSPIPAGHGISNSQILLCDSQPGCLECLMNFQVCTLCDTVRGYYLLGVYCIHFSVIPPGYGVNGNTVAQCDSQPACIDCTSNYQT